jgi:hypothetical protein
MESSALIMMIVVQLTFTAITGFFFYKVLTTPSKPEPDSYTDNDPVEENE